VAVENFLSDVSTMQLVRNEITALVLFSAGTGDKAHDRTGWCRVLGDDEQTGSNAL
jgi:hypothetical protein